MTRRSLPLVLVLLFLAACQGDDDGGQQATATTATIPVETTAATTTTTAKPTTTEVSERLAHWQDVVKSMKCPELADLEQKRLAIAFNDQAESLIAIHDRQTKLSCPP